MKRTLPEIRDYRGFGIVYLTTNTANEKVYVGQTTEKLTTRWSEQLNEAQRTDRNRPILNAIRKYGASAFSHKILAVAANRSELDYLEQYFVVLFNSNVPAFGYNATVGGDKGCEGYRHTPESLAKISAANRKRIWTKESRDKLAASQTGKPGPKGIPSKLRGRKQSTEIIQKRVATIRSRYAVYPGGGRRRGKPCSMTSSLFE